MNRSGRSGSNDLLLFFLLEQVDNFITANKTKIFTGNAFEVAPVRFKSNNLALYFTIFRSAVSQAHFNFVFVLLKLKNPQ